MDKRTLKVAKLILFLEQVKGGNEAVINLYENVNDLSFEKSPFDRFQLDKKDLELILTGLHNLQPSLIEKILPGAYYET